MTFSYLSVCSGLGGCSLALKPLGATPVGFAEIELFPSAILAERYPDVTNFGDFTRIPMEKLGRVDVLIGGTPCQAFSLAGKRLSLDDARGNLSLSYVVLAHELARSYGLRNCIWENVPGVLSTKDNAFGCFLGALVGHDGAIANPSGRRWPNAGMVAGPRARLAWRVLDAQHFGVPQRRRRVFVVADFGNGADPAAVLFEPQSVQGDNSTRRKNREIIAPTINAGPKSGRSRGTDFDCDGGLIAVAYDLRGREGGAQFEGPHNTANIRAASGGSSRSYISSQLAVRRLTPTECERLQGMPDDWTKITWRGKPADQCPDGPRYKAIGNSWAIPVVQWIGRRLLENTPK